MEVEIKIRLPDRAAYDKVASSLSASKGTRYEQDNWFFDGPNRELNAQRVVLRVRMYNKGEKAVLTLKGKQVLEAGIGRATEVEEDMQVETAQKVLAGEPSLLLSSSELVKKTAETFGLTSLVPLGGFHNVRTEFSWQGHTVELDETQFSHGTLYEIECETDHPEDMKVELEAFLQAQGVSYSYSQTSKFANFVNTSLL